MGSDAASSTTTDDTSPIRPSSVRVSDLVAVEQESPIRPDRATPSCTDHATPNRPDRGAPSLSDCAAPSCPDLFTPSSPHRDASSPSKCNPPTTVPTSTGKGHTSGAFRARATPSSTSSEAMNDIDDYASRSEADEENSFCPSDVDSEEDAPSRMVQPQSSFGHASHSVSLRTAARSIDEYAQGDDGGAKEDEIVPREADVGVDVDVQTVGQKRPYRYITRRKRRTEESAMRKRWEGTLASRAEQDMSTFKCCKRQKCFRRADPDFLKEKTQRLLRMKTEERRQSLRDMMGSNGRFLFDGNQVCANFLVRAFHFSRDLQASVRGSDANKRRVSNNIQGKKDSVRSAKHKDAIITYLERVADNTGDQMPDRNEVHLPFFRKDDVYVHFKEEFALIHDVEPPSFEYFRQVWRKHSSNIKVRKVMRFSKCGRCEELRASIQHAITNRIDATELRRQKAVHREMIQKERREYKKKRDNAVVYPDRFCSIIVDGADQSAYGLPHFVVKSKDARGHSLKVKVVGVLEHGKPHRAHLMTLTEDHETGANHIVEAVHRFLSLRRERGPIPPVLYIQLDNCSRENKNRYFLGYVEYLVACGVFERAEVSFLPVGHTHEDIDQVFSCTSNRLRSHDAITLLDMHKQLRTVFNEHTEVLHMKYVANWSGLCETSGALAKVTLFSHFRYFLFTRRNSSINISDDAHTSCSARVACTDQWQSLRTVQDVNGGFLSKVPNIRDTPRTLISLPPGKDEVSKRFQSEETRINSTAKLRELHEIRDHVFQVRKDIFHWNLESCLELSGRTVRERAAESNSDNEEDRVQAIEMEMPTEELVRNDYDYEVNSYVAVNTADDDGAPFWVGKVVEKVVNAEGIVNELIVHWLQLDNGSDVYGGRYTLTFLQNGKRFRKRAWKTSVPADSVMVTFDSLTKKNRLPVRVQNQLRSSAQK